MLASLLLACAPVAPPAAPSAAAPAPAGKPAEAPPQAAPAKPAAAAQPVASPAPVTAAGPAKGSITIVNESEPNTLVPKDVSSALAYVVMNNLYESLTARGTSEPAPPITSRDHSPEAPRVQRQGNPPSTGGT